MDAAHSSENKPEITSLEIDDLVILLSGKDSAMLNTKLKFFHFLLLIWPNNLISLPAIFATKI